MSLAVWETDVIRIEQRDRQLHPRPTHIKPCWRKETRIYILIYKRLEQTSTENPILCNDRMTAVREKLLFQLNPSENSPKSQHAKSRSRIQQDAELRLVGSFGRGGTNSRYTLKDSLTLGEGLSPPPRSSRFVGTLPIHSP